jgi:hypothetical protein
MKDVKVCCCLAGLRRSERRLGSEVPGRRKVQERSKMRPGNGFRRYPAIASDHPERLAMILETTVIVVQVP